MNDLGITKEEARAALRELDTWAMQPGVTAALDKLGWTGCAPNTFGSGRTYVKEIQTALSMIASIGGAVDGRGRPK